jgi:hypothetical protein
MGRDIRHIEPGCLYEVTNRTLQGRLLLRPSPSLNEIILGILGWAQSATGLVIHAFVFLSNHYHLLCTPRDAQQLSNFECLLNSRLAREVGRLHKWRDKIWAGRFRPIAVSEEPAAQIARLRYLLSHGCKEGFVLSPGDWPGVHCVGALLDGTPLQGSLFDRSLEYEANRQGEEFGGREFATTQTVVLTPLPCWAHLSPGELADRLAEMIAEIEGEAARRQKETGRPPVGRDFVRRQNPHEQPWRSKHSAAPRVHAASRAVRQLFIARFRAFVGAYRQAAERLRAGELAVAFPTGCFPPPRGFMAHALRPSPS